MLMKDIRKHKTYTSCCLTIFIKEHDFEGQPSQGITDFRSCEWAPFNLGFISGKPGSN